MKQMKNNYDAIVIGAGPAGLTCSAELARQGLSVAVLDEQAGPGGQIYRNITKTTRGQHGVLGADYTKGLDLVEGFIGTAPDYFPQARVWQAEPTGEVWFSRNGASRKLTARYIVMTTGAMERPVPFPGWTLPGVMTCGGVSNLFKDSGLFPNEPLVLAGSGPFLWLVADHLLHLGAPMAAILDTTPAGRIFSGLKHMPGAMMRMGFMMKGVKMLGAVRLAALKARVPIYRGIKNVEAEGDERLERVRALCGGKELQFDTNTLVVHEGIIPNIALTRQVGVTHAWDPVQRYRHPDVTDDGRTNLPSVYVAGDGNFVHGAVSAELKGKLTALSIAREMKRLGKDDYELQATAVRKELRKELLPRPFIDALYAPRKDLYEIPDDALVCRCEGITAGRVREIASKGYSDPNEIKSLIRCGMGPCQGRMCGPAIMEIIGSVSGDPVEDARQLRVRPPIKPVSLQELANAELGGTDES